MTGTQMFISILIGEGLAAMVGLIWVAGKYGSPRNRP